MAWVVAYSSPFVYLRVNFVNWASVMSIPRRGSLHYLKKWWKPTFCCFKELVLYPGDICAQQPIKCTPPFHDPESASLIGWNNVWATLFPISHSHEYPEIFTHRRGMWREIHRMWQSMFLIITEDHTFNHSVRQALMERTQLQCCWVKKRLKMALSAHLGALWVWWCPVEVVWPSLTLACWEPLVPPLA